MTAPELLVISPNDRFARLAALARDLLDAPVALLVLGSAEESLTLTALSVADRPPCNNNLDFVAHALGQRAGALGPPLITRVAREAMRHGHHRGAATTGILTYAATALSASAGPPFGALCVIGVGAQDWDDHQLATLAVLARTAAEMCTSEVFAFHGTHPSGEATAPQL